MEKEGGRSGNNSSFHGNCLILGPSSPTSRFVPLPSPLYPTDPNYPQCNVAVIIREMVFLSRNGPAGSTWTGDGGSPFQTRSFLLVNARL